MESSFSWTYPIKSPTSSTLCFGEPTLRKLNQIKCCVIPYQTLYVTSHLECSIKKLSFISLNILLLFILELHSLYHVEKPQFSIVLISSCAFLKSKITCLHVSFTTYEYFYKLSKSASFSRWILHPVTQKNQ